MCSNTPTMPHLICRRLLQNSPWLSWRPVGRKDHHGEWRCYLHLALLNVTSFCLLCYLLYPVEHVEHQRRPSFFFYKLDITEKSGNRRGQKQDTLSAFDTDSFPEKKQQPCTTSTTTTTSKTACAL